MPASRAGPGADHDTLPPVNYLSFELSDSTDGIHTLEAMAATRSDQPDAAGAVQAEVRQVLDWAWQAFGHSHGPVDEGGDWDHELQQHDEAGWCTVSLTLTASPAFLQAFEERFGRPGDEP